LLRDICITLGIVMNFSHDLILDNETDIVRAKITARIQAQKKKDAKKPQQNLPDDEVFQYSNLPFKQGDVSDFNPIVKHLNLGNKDASICMQQARQAQSEGHLETAFDLFSQAVNIMLQVIGPMHPDVAQCIAKMANI